MQNAMSAIDDMNVRFIDPHVVGTNVQNIKEDIKAYKSFDTEENIDTTSPNDKANKISSDDSVPLASLTAVKTKFTEKNNSKKTKRALKSKRYAKFDIKKIAPR